MRALAQARRQGAGGGMAEQQGAARRGAHGLGDVQACGERSGKRIGERRLVLFDDAANGSAKAIPAGSALGEIRTAHERIAQAILLDRAISHQREVAHDERNLGLEADEGAPGNREGCHLRGAADHGIERGGNERARHAAAPRAGNVARQGASLVATHAHDQVLGGDTGRGKLGILRKCGLGPERIGGRDASNDSVEPAVDERATHGLDMDGIDVIRAQHIGARGLANRAGEELGKLIESPEAKADIGAPRTEGKQLAANRHIRPRSKRSSATV